MCVGVCVCGCVCGGGAHLKRKRKVRYKRKRLVYVDNVDIEADSIKACELRVRAGGASARRGVRGEM